MAHYDNNRGAWVDSSGNTHSSEAAARKASSNFQTEVAGAGAGCAAYVLIGSAAAVAFVSALAYIWPFAVVLLGAFLLAWLVAELYDRKLLKSKTPFFIALVVVVVASFPYILHKQSKQDFVPALAGVATVSPEAAGGFARYQKKGFFSSKLVAEDSITLAPNEQVKLCGSKTGTRYLEVEKSDGTKGFISGTKTVMVNKQQKSVDVFKEKDITLAPPLKFWTRVFKADFRPARPGVLQAGKYFPEGGKVEGIARIEVPKLPVKYFNKKTWEVDRMRLYTDESPYSCTRFMVRNDPPLEVKGVPYSFTLSVLGSDGKTFNLVVTSTSTLTSTDGKVTYRLKVEGR